MLPGQKPQAEGVIHRHEPPRSREQMHISTFMPSCVTTPDRPEVTRVGSR
jgi:hypothetical protein